MLVLLVHTARYYGVVAVVIYCVSEPAHHSEQTEVTTEQTDRAALITGRWRAPTVGSATPRR